MAVTNEAADLVLNLEASPPKLNDNTLSRAHLVMERFSFTQGAAAGDANSTIRAVKLPPRARYCAAFSWVRFSAFGTARVLSLGWEAYRDPISQETEPPSLTGLGTALNVAAAGTAFLSSLTGAVDDKEFTGEVILAFQCTGGTIPAGATVAGIIAYSMP